MTPRVQYVLGFGAGVNTVALMIWLRKHKHPLDFAIFADTGAELPETYSYVRSSAKYLAEIGVPMVTVRSRRGTLYNECQRRRVIPSKMWRWSTRDFKVTPIHRYYANLRCHIFEYVGIAYDEIGRMRSSSDPSITTLYPLVDAKLTRDDCIRIIQQEGLPVPVKSGCFFCPFNNVERWKWISENHPELYEKATALEEGSKHFPNQRLSPRGLRGLRKSGFRPLARGEIPELPCGANCLS